jgi:undecaprenyl-diphosphatase
MNIIQAIVLGIVQGLTGLFPVSSSAHLILFQNLMGLKESVVFFDICVHAGTLFAVIYFFRKDIRDMAVSVFDAANLLLRKDTKLYQTMEHPEAKLLILIIIGSIPTAIIGLLFHKIADHLFSSVFLVGFTLIATGIALWTTRRLKDSGNDIENFTARQALIIGIVQGLAVIPGISRSGSTISTGLFLGLSRETAGRYSFLLSIPSIFGATFLGLINLPGGVSIDMPTIVGTTTAGIVGYFALRLLFYIIRKGNLHWFAPYCWFIGAIALMAG